MSNVYQQLEIFGKELEVREFKNSGGSRYLQLEKISDSMLINKVHIFYSEINSEIKIV